MSSLLLRPQPQDAEGPSSYRMRLAHSNILPFGMVDDEDVYGTKDDGVTTLIWQRWLHLLSEKSVWLHRRARWCPRCLGNHSYGRVGWELLFADACAACGDWLVDVCYLCGTPVTWHRPSIKSCHCGADLCAAPSRPAPLAVARLSQAMEQLILGSHRIEIPQVQNLSPMQCSQLVRLLGAYGSTQHMRVPLKITAVNSLDVSWTLSTVAAEVLVTWPSGFHHLLNRESKNAAGRENSGRLPGVFGGLYRALYRTLKESEFDWLRSAFEDYIADNWAGAMGRRNLRMPDSLWSRLCWVPISVASSQMGASKRQLIKLIDAGQIQATRRTTESGRDFVMVRQSDIEVLFSSATDDMCLAEASVCLGVKRQRLSRLLPSLCADARKLTLHGTPWLIPKAWVNKWVEKLHEWSIVETIPSGAISLDELLRYGPLDEHRVSVLLQDVDCGRFTPLGRHDGSIGLSSLLFDRDQLLEKYGGQTNALLSIPEAATRMGVKQEVAYALATLGLLQVETYVTGRRRAQGVSVNALEKFRTSYVLATDLAKLLRRSPRAVIAALAVEGIDQVAGPSRGNCRQAVYSRKILDMIPWLAPYGVKRGDC